MMKKVLYLLMIALLVCSLSACGSSNSSKVVEFNDEVLEGLIRTAMNNPDGDILISDALSITEFDFRMDGNDWSSPRINNLDALKYFTNLKYLDLSWAVQNEEGSFLDVDISVLSALTKMELLQLGCVNISDISALSSMTELKTLVLWGGFRIDDISSLAGLTNLEALDLKNNIIKDLGPLTGLQKLSYLDITNNLISDVSPLAGLTNLKELYLTDNLIRDYTPLGDICSNLQKRDFEPVASPQPIDFKDAVLEQKIREALSIPNGDITINDTEAVTDLYLNNQTSELPEESKISNINALKYFPNLFKLDIYNNNIQQIDVLRALPNLGLLNLDGNRIFDISAISACPNLILLHLSGCNSTAQQLAMLFPFARLEALDLSYANNLANVEFLSEQTSLNWLDLKGTPVDLSPLVGLTNLKALYLAEPVVGRPETDYSVLKDIYPNLTDKNFEMPKN